VSEKELAEYYQNAKALIMPQEERFWYCFREAQSFGVPVIAYRKGGALDTVIPGKQDISSIIRQPILSRRSLNCLMSRSIKNIKPVIVSKMPEILKRSI